MSRLTFVACVDRPDVARACLLASPCLRPEAGHQLILATGMPDAGAGFRWAQDLGRHDWIVLVHQDVFLPPGWDETMVQSLARAQQRWPSAAVVGVYGVTADGAHAGHVYDRDRWLGKPFTEARKVRSLDELLLVVRRRCGLEVESSLGWHLYGTDLCLQAEAMGLDAVVVDAACEHRSSLPRSTCTQDPVIARALVERIRAFNASARQLALRWPRAMPVCTAVARIDEHFEMVEPVVS